MNAIQKLIDLALEEDLGHGDITTQNLIDPDASGKARIMAKAPCIIAGLPVVRQVFHRLNSGICCQSDFKDGDAASPGATVMCLEGRLQALLQGERTALNFIQRLSGIATLTRQWVNALQGRPTRLVDTRKTTPGLRVLEKYAVRIGGGYNHRMGLFDGVLIKDNHIAACGGIQPAVARIKNLTSHLVKIEVEASSLEEVHEALSAQVDVIMLDNMDIPMISRAVELIAGRALVEVSGGVSLDRLTALADTGVDIISAGALTHSAVSVDLSMNILCTGLQRNPA